MFRKSAYFSVIILGKVAVVFLILYFNLGMFGFDSYIHLQYVDSILTNGHITELSIAQSYYDFVGFHVFASAISSLTGLSAEMLYEFISTIIPILIFDLSIVAFIHHTEKKKKGYTTQDFNLQYLALILLFPSIIGIQMFLGRPNSLGISLFCLCLYLYLCKPKSFRAQLIAGFLAIVTVKVHHLSAVFLIPVILFVSIFLAEDYKSILSLVYALPAVIIVNTILNSREFSIVNYYFTRNEFYETLYNIFIKNMFSLLVLWVIITLIGFLVRKRYGKRISELFTKQKFSKTLIMITVGGMVIIQIIGLFFYTSNLPSWYVSTELVILFLLSGVALIKPNRAKYTLFILGFCFYGLTVIFSLVFSATEHELSWVAPRTFVFTIIFVGILGFISISGFLKSLKKKWSTLLIAALLFNSYLSLAYMGEQYLPGYNLTNEYYDITFAYNIRSNVDYVSSTISMPFSISKFIPGINIYGIPLLLDSNSSMETNALRMRSSFFIRYIVICEVMDQWLGTPIILTPEELTFYLCLYYNDIPLFHLITSNSKNFLLYRT
ncbi:MAG: hypothetical protein H7641_09705 [Candidatus Heimdallarchaeota archaeon]|nr:hypothetical protein [Candidatus Heimdallarchaeota archaeon]MCK4877836.1 hypothetical protein [Candidatus Heimdallarchaeota archaeon]